MTYEDLAAQIGDNSNRLINEIDIECSKVKYIDNIGPEERLQCRIKIWFTLILEMMSIWDPQHINPYVLHVFRDRKLKYFICGCSVAAPNEMEMRMHVQNVHRTIFDLIDDFRSMITVKNLKRIFDLDFDKLADASKRSI